MTASTISSSTNAAGRAGTSRRLAGFGPLFRKDVGEWRHGKRAWVILIVTTLFLVLTAANGAIQSWVIANAPGAEAPSQPISLVPLDNFMAAVASQMAVVVAIFAAMSLLVAERDHGTLAWVASKPVSRGAIWASKWLAAAIVVSVIAGLLPLVAVFAVSTALYGPVDIGVALVAAAGVVASVTFIVAVVLAASTVISNQPAVAAIGFGVFFLPQLIRASGFHGPSPILAAAFPMLLVLFGAGALTPAAHALLKFSRPRSCRGPWASRPAPMSGS